SPCLRASCVAADGRGDRTRQLHREDGRLSRRTVRRLTRRSSWRGCRPLRSRRCCGPPAGRRVVNIELVVKVGGSLLKHVEELDRVLGVLAEVGRARRLLIVPGGGPFADAVRAVDAHVRLSDDAAHWMAILAMDQHAHLIAERLVHSALVTSTTEIADAQSRARIPVLAPYRWLRDADPLPHSWDVTSDSIAAWFAHEVEAAQLVLIK